MNITKRNFDALLKQQSDHNSGGGLILRVSGGSAQYRLRPTISGKRTWIVIGTHPETTIEDAQAQAATMKAAIKRGENPLRALEKAEVADQTVADAIQATFESKQASLKGGGVNGRWISSLEVHVIPKIGHLPISDLAVNDIVKVIKPIWVSKPSAAEKALTRLGQAIRHAKPSGVPVTPELILDARTVLGKQGHVVTHFRSMPWQDVPAFYASLGDLDSHLALKQTILTASRSGPVSMATVGQFDL